jgi:hypothetical protein
MGYAIDGVEGKELTLVRGVTYRLQLQDVPVTYPLYLTTSPAGAGRDGYYRGVDGSFVSGNGVLIFTPDATTPPTLYYNSSSLHYPYMGGAIHVADVSAAPLESNVGAGIGLSEPYPNPANGHVTLSLAVRSSEHVRVALYDMSGELSMVLHDGMVTAGGAFDLGFDASVLSGGIYECVAVGRTFVSRRRVVVPCGR